MSYSQISLERVKKLSTCQEVKYLHVTGGPSKESEMIGKSESSESQTNLPISYSWDPRCSQQREITRYVVRHGHCRVIRQVLEKRDPLCRVHVLTL